MNKYMLEAIKLAKKAYKKGEVPVGAVIVEKNKIIARGYNCKIHNNDVTAHAEIVAIRSACKKKHTTYLNDCEIYVTLEPCMMCVGAIIQSHIKTIVYSTKSYKYGYLDKIDKSKINIINIESSYETTNLLQKFFENKR